MSSIDNKLSNHNHDDLYYTEDEVDTLLNNKSDTTHTHDDRYYTETEIDNKISNLNNNINNVYSIAKAQPTITVEANSSRDFSFTFSIPSNATILVQFPIICSNGLGITVGRNLSIDYTVRLWNNTNVTKNVDVYYYVIYKI